MDINPTLAQLERLAAAEQALQLLGAFALSFIIGGICLAVWNSINRRDP